MSACLKGGSGGAECASLGAKGERSLSLDPDPFPHPHPTPPHSYTLGGFYLARYDDSPVGAFDEVREREKKAHVFPACLFFFLLFLTLLPPSFQLVAMAGLVWNAPTSCAWAARVYVSNRAARNHGRAEVGLPSRVATFDACAASPPTPSWWDSAGTTPSVVHLVNEERARSWTAPLRGRRGGRAGLPGGHVATLELPQVTHAWAPRLRLSLPSFSGATPDCPHLLKYACQLATRVRPVRPARVSARAVGASGDDDNTHHAESLAPLLGGRPLLALSFGDMVMVVNEPERVDVGGRQQGRPQSALLA